ncbi:MAG: glucose-6-phosphate isomerase [Nitrospirae bacterium]|nr:glucose-6-phosphate isomerase [Nitrospirota bacterium]
MIKIDFSNLMQESLGSYGLARNDFDSVSATALSELQQTERYPENAFLGLPDADTAAIKDTARYAGEFDNFLLLGIGGSALGPRSILDAIYPFHNLRGKNKVLMYDNVDPMTLKSILDIVDLKNTVINVITKSGSTAETIASFMILWQRLKDLSLDPKKHLIITTDPSKGHMRSIVNDHGLRSLPVPQGVGGRYSVLSSVGLLPAKTVGVDIDEMLRGAADIHKSCLNADLWKNPAYLTASGLFLMQRLKNRDITVMIPYADRLKSFSEWFCQLWGESLGKEGKGLSPYPSTGTTDQHSQLQLWMEGPLDKVVIFLAVEDYGTDIEIPAVFQDIEGLGYLAGHSLAELIKIEQEASEIALTKNSRPNITVRVPAVNAYYLGQLFHFFELVTALTGILLGINPFNQPGVEEGKNLTYGMMGKKGYEEKKQEFLKYRSQKNRLVL